MKDGVIELALHHPPCNEIGTAMLNDLEQFAAALESVAGSASALIIHSLAAGWILGRRRSTRALRGGDVADGGRTRGRRA